MKKIAILGCENSHADAFIECVIKKPEFSHIQVAGIYSQEIEAAEKLSAKYGLHVMASYDELAGQVDGVMITARHGQMHYAFAKPYLSGGIPLFIDKPITICADEAVAFMNDLKKCDVKVTGGSSLRHSYEVQAVKLAQQQQVGGCTVGGTVRAPLKSDSPYGGFFFYAAHLAAMVLEAFGLDLHSVEVRRDTQGNLTILFDYGSFIVTGLYTEGGNEYYLTRFSHKGSQGGYVPFTTSKEWFYAEFKAFAGLMEGEPPAMSRLELFAPVFVLDAIYRASQSGKAEPVRYREA